MNTPWFVYIIESDDKKLYTGITTDVVRRWSEHMGKSQGKYKGAKFFRGRKPSQLLFLVKLDNRPDASRYEFQTKQLTRKEKFNLIDSDKNQVKELTITLPEAS